jgi:hypothetical protein
MGVTAFVNKLLVHGAVAYETVLQQVERDLNSNQL